MTRSGSVAGRKLRILLHYPVLNLGGAETSTLRLLHGLADRGCDVHLVLTTRGGNMEQAIDPRVQVHALRDSVGRFPSRIQTIADVVRFAGASFVWLRGRLQQVIRARRFRHLAFDGAIAGLHGLSPDFICTQVTARRRIVMVRNDAEDDARGRLADNVARYADRIDQYVCVSKSVLASLVARFPQLQTKSVCIYNLIDPGSMRAKAVTGNNPFPDPQDVPTVLSVCRLSEPQKQLIRMVRVHRRLLDAGLAHTWHVLGDGPDRALLERAIAEHGVASSFILHGAVSNPFPYYRHADIVAVLSRYEGLCGVVNEARVLSRPVIATRFAGIEEQIESGINGLIVEQDVDAICSGMTALLTDLALRQRLASGGYPADLLDDDAKLDAVLDLIRAESSAEIE